MLPGGITKSQRHLTGWCNGLGTALGTESAKAVGQIPAVPWSGNNHGQVLHTRASVTKQYNLASANLVLAVNSDAQWLGR